MRRHQHRRAPTRGVFPEIRAPHHLHIRRARFRTMQVHRRIRVRRDITSGLSGAVARIRKAIKASNWATQRLSVRKKPAQMGASTLSFSLKVVLTITNSQPTRVLVQANGFEFGKGITCHPRASSTQPPRWSG